MPSTPLSFALPSEASNIRARADAILWIKSAVARHGITVQQLERAGCFANVRSDDTADKFAKYKDAMGHIWDGAGCVPEWLQRAINAGQSMDHFRIA